MLCGQMAYSNRTSVHSCGSNMLAPIHIFILTGSLKSCVHNVYTKHVGHRRNTRRKCPPLNLAFITHHSSRAKSPKPPTIRLHLPIRACTVRSSASNRRFCWIARRQMRLVVASLLFASKGLLNLLVKHACKLCLNTK